MTYDEQEQACNHRTQDHVCCNVSTTHHLLCSTNTFTSSHGCSFSAGVPHQWTPGIRRADSGRQGRWRLSSAPSGTRPATRGWWVGVWGHVWGWG